MSAAEPTPAAHADADLSYEQARAALEEVVQRLEDKDLPLEEMMSLWERGERLAAVCDERLAGAKARLDAVRRGLQDDPAG
jgi:exodeoxyribonuclease VII small subunit